MVCKKGVFRNFAIFTVKHLCQSLFFNKVADLRLQVCTWPTIDIFSRAWSTALLKKRFWHRWFPVNFAKFLRTTFLQNIAGPLLLSVDLRIFGKNLLNRFIYSIKGDMYLYRYSIEGHVSLKLSWFIGKSILIQNITEPNHYKSW